MEHLEISVSEFLNFYKTQNGEYYMCQVICKMLKTKGVYLTRRYRFDGMAAISTIMSRELHRLIPEHILARVPPVSGIQNWFRESSKFQREIYYFNAIRSMRNLRIKVLEEILQKDPNAVIRIPMTAVRNSSHEVAKTIQATGA